MYNATRQTGANWRIPDTLLPQQLAWIIAKLHPICLIEMTGRNSDKTGKILGLYQTEGENEGIYIIDEEAFEKLAESYHYLVYDKELQEMFSCLKRCVPQKQKCKEKNLIAVNNGIFDYDTKTLLPFTPDLVFMSKSRVNYNLTAEMIIKSGDGTLCRL